MRWEIESSVLAKAFTLLPLFFERGLDVTREEMSEVLVNGPEERQSSVHLQRSARGHRDTRQLKEKRNHAQERQLPEEGHSG